MKSKAFRRAGLRFLAGVMALAILAACAPAAPQPKPAPVAPPPAKAPAAKASAADFYRDKTVTLVVPYGAGGGTDFGARALASFWTEVTGGAMIVKNITGGAGLEGMNSVYAANPDGLTLVFAITGTQTAQQVFELAGARFDLSKMAVVGDFAREEIVLAVGAGSPHKSMDDLVKTSGLLFGATSPRSGDTQASGLAIEIFGLKDGRVVTGYKSTPEIEVAMGRGEVHAYTLPAQTIRSGMDKGLVKKPFVTLDFQRTPIFPDVPAVTEMLRLTPEQETWLRIVTLLGDQSKMVVGPPGIPEDRVQFLRESFNKLMENKAFVGQMKLRFQGWTGDFRKGEDVAAQVQKLVALPKDDLTKFDKMLERHVK